MKNSYIAYNILLNIEKNEEVINKAISYISNEKLIKKLSDLLIDFLKIKNKVYNYVYKDLNQSKINKKIIKEKYEEYKNIISFL